MKVKFTIPEGMHDVTIAKWKRVQAATENAVSDTAKVAKVVAILCDVEERQVMGLTTDGFNQLQADLQWAMKPTREDWPLIPTTYIDGIEYGFIPDLSDLSVGEFADLDSLVSKGNAYDHLEEVMAILYRPVTKRWRKFYDIEDYDPKPKDKEVMKEMTMDVALGAVVFFWRIAERLAKDLAPYSQRLAQRMGTP